jgi:hypothetical protein
MTRIISAKYQSDCRNYRSPRCPGRISVGERVNYEQGMGVWHLGCSTPTTEKYDAQEREELARANDEIEMEEERIEQGFWQEWTREATIARRAEFNAAKITPADFAPMLGLSSTYVERLGYSMEDLKRAIRYYGL